MTAYLIADIVVTDPAGYETYRLQAPAVIAQYGGRYLVRGGTIHTLEGSLGLDRCVVVEFASLEAARAFYESPEYAPLLKLRSESTRSRVAFVEGVAG
jgi:uncharacterized protein (DUF1330 family)